jgi:hypothetical protein
MDIKSRSTWGSASMIANISTSEMQEMIEICFPIHPTYKMVLVYQVLYRQSCESETCFLFSSSKFMYGKPCLPGLNMFEQDENDDRFLSSTNTDGALVVLWIGFLIPCVAYGNAI